MTGKKFWIVMNSATMIAVAQRYESFGGAEEKARILAKDYPQHDFTVCVGLATYKAVSVQKTTLIEG